MNPRVILEVPRNQRPALYAGPMRHFDADGLEDWRRASGPLNRGRADEDALEVWPVQAPDELGWIAAAAAVVGKAYEVKRERDKKKRAERRAKELDRARKKAAKQQVAAEMAGFGGVDWRLIGLGVAGVAVVAGIMWAMRRRR